MPNEIPAPEPASLPPNLLMNPGFDQAPGGPTKLSGSAHGGYSAAPNWGTWNNTDADTTTDVLPSTRPGGESTMMLHVCTSAQSNGIVQVFERPSPGSGPPATYAGAWVFVLRGIVAIGTGDGGNTQADTLSTTTGEWEHLEAANGVSPANEFIAYSGDANGACYYVTDTAVYIAQSEPGQPDPASTSAMSSTT